MQVPSAALTPAKRLRRRADFAALQGSKARISARSFHARYLPNECGHARLGLAISKRVSKRAVERNRLKRLVRESFRRAWPDLPAVDLLVMARPQASGVHGAQLLLQLRELWAKLPHVDPEPTRVPPEH